MIAAKVLLFQASCKVTFIIYLGRCWRSLRALCYVARYSLGTDELIYYQLSALPLRVTSGFFDLFN